jgi:hypothetical protein
MRASLLDMRLVIVPTQRDQRSIVAAKGETGEQMVGKAVLVDHHNVGSLGQVVKPTIKRFDLTLVGDVTHTQHMAGVAAHLRADGRQPSMFTYRQARRRT